ncbi:hypothetical protein I6F14_33200 [Bradyrhizobium sp. IC3069]|uniref:hypothetical protein n=1 Tax=unclassified Bradyrhizobium TaxID=2631580 RepID=UPI001CD4411D|nr:MULTISPECIES: hypothetical protein [unclassified Bradyrhizobium]MCA1365128.1 hypothetical protein [Bradyrhizobium sp. IC4059]MCA1522792.1 hypothetical protein [Bradyrhizobium sp. IC3069]
MRSATSTADRFCWSANGGLERTSSRNVAMHLHGGGIVAEPPNQEKPEKQRCRARIRVSAAPVFKLSTEIPLAFIKQRPCHNHMTGWADSQHPLFDPLQLSSELNSGEAGNDRKHHIGAELG